MQLAVVVVLGASAILAKPSSGRTEEAPVVIAASMDVNSLDPHRGSCDICQIYNTSTYETLVSLDVNNKIAPLLAEHWEVDHTQTKFTFHISPDAKFSDGSPVEAKDVKWSLERLRNLSGGMSYLLSNLATVETPDSKTVVATTKTPSSEFLGVLAAPYCVIVNSDVASANGAKAGSDAATSDNAEAWFLSHSAGSGPYKLVSYEPNSELRLARNEAYWRKPPAVGEFVLREVKDAVVQAQMLRSGGADIALQIDPDTAKALDADPSVTVSSKPSYNFIYIAFSPRAKSNKVSLTKEIRSALMLGIDQAGIIDLTLGGAGRPMSTPIPLGFPGADGFEARRYDPMEAKRQLAAAGAADGFTLDSVYPNVNAYGVDTNMMMQKVQQDLLKIGVGVDLHPVPIATWREKVNGEEGVALTAGLFAPDFFGTSQYADFFMMIPDTTWGKRAGVNLDPSMVNNSEPELLKRALEARGDEADILWHKLGQELIDDGIIMPIVSPNVIFAHRADIKGVRNSACCNMPLAEISR
ncbi:ABC transporter substrate-binding protein [Rhizobium tubonense]|uniref:ABC transporter substrate-binding protein n=1 Tax=Rhizobium tubonense TaxID=484088 RepID=A0A2W4CK16_9HYPH|nr:ABC transporter substrate-binding protein [Rhizobium tubonense]